MNGARHGQGRYVVFLLLGLEGGIEKELAVEAARNLHWMEADLRWNPELNLGPYRPSDAD